MKKDALVGTWTADSNPRKAGVHKERGPESFDCVTYGSIAELAGVEPSRVRAELRMHDTEKGDASTFREIFEFVTARVRRSGKKLTDSEAAAQAGPQWPRRYPRFDLWTCGHAGCDELSLESPRCGEHGGAPAFRITDKGALEFCVGSEWRLYAEVVTGAESHEDVEHLDDNKWNCHPLNLVVRARKGLRYRQWAAEEPGVVDDVVDELLNKVDPD